MRLVSWNCNGALRRKTAALDALEADILVVQECEDPSAYGADYRTWCSDYLWTGDLRSKGLGVFSRTGLKMERLHWKGNECRLFLPTRIDSKFNLLGVWTQNAKPTSAGYIAQFWRYFQINRELIDQNTVLCGDFNSNLIWDKQRQIGNHGQCVAALAELGLHSLYHHAQDEAHGVETVPTFYLYRKPERPYHIDYIFAHGGLSRHPDFMIEIGPTEHWLALSDHLPLITNLPI